MGHYGTSFIIIQNFFDKIMDNCERGKKMTQKMETTTYVGDSQLQFPSVLSNQPNKQKQDSVKNRKQLSSKITQNDKMNDLGFIAATYIQIKIIQQVENNNTRQCKYLIFHVPFTLMLCDTLQLHHTGLRTVLFDILIDQVKILQELNSKSPLQLPANEVMTIIAMAMNFEKVPKGYFLRELAKFVEKYSNKLGTFIPYYDALFKLVLRRDSYIGKQTTIEQQNELFSKTVAEIRSKYHNFDLQ